MINCNARRFIKCFHMKQKFLLTFRCQETTSVIKSKYEKQEEWEKKMKFYMKAYEDLFGITRLTEMHEKVIDVQANLQSIQEKRRKVQEDIFNVQKKLHEMQDILHKTSMGDDMYISVVTQVRELLKEQKRLQDVFSLYDQTEREQQTALALAINNSQDHERTYREKNKYLSLITGIIGGVLGLVGSSINNWRHRKDIKNFAADISNQVVDLKKSVEKLKQVSLADGIALNTLSNEITETEDIISKIKSQHNILDDSIKSLQSLLNNKPVDQRTDSQGTDSDDSVKDILNEFERNIESKLNNYAYINLSLVGSCALFSTLFLIFISKYG